VTRRPPPRNRAQVQHSTTFIKNKEVVRHEDQEELVNVDIEPGDAKVSVGYDCKQWGSDRVGGLTVGTSAHVTLSCNQRVGVMRVANDVAAELAWSFMKRNRERAKDVLIRYANGEDI
jgi:hypothetical protein